MRKWASRVRANTSLASVTPRLRDLEWAAGFLDGEGSFVRSKSSKRGCEMVVAPQKEIQPLLKLQALFGGNLTTWSTPYDYKMNVWQVYGSRARGVMMTLFSLMTDKRKEQIKLALKEI